MTVSDGDVLRAVLQMAYPDNNIAQMVFWFLADFLVGQDDNDVAGAIEGYLEDFLGPVDDWIEENMTVDQTDVNEMVWNGVDEVWEVDRFVGTVEPELTFTETGELLPFQSAPVLVANTTRPKSRGRKSIPGFTELAQSATTLVPSAITTLAVTLANYLADETISSNNDLLVGVASTVTGTFLQFTDGVINDVMGTQRRRKPGVGA